jgi:predicted N-acetyltransferase YhbS
MNADALTVIAPDRRKHGEEICDLCAKAFSGSGYYYVRDCSRHGHILGSHYDWSASRIGLIDGRVVTHWGVWDYRMRIGAARVRVGGIGSVATDGDFRKRGLMAQTAGVSVAAMRELGYDLSILFGIDDFYYRFGYVRAWSDTTFTVALKDLPTGRPGVRVRRFRPFERSDITAIYNRENAAATGTAVKPTYPRYMYPRLAEGRLWTDARGRAIGYVVFLPKGNLIECVEAGGDIEQILRVLAALARQAGRQDVQFTAFPDSSPLIRRIRLGNCRAETHHRRCGGPMICTINLASTLEKTAPELGRRLRGSLLADWRGRLLIADSREAATLAVDRSRISVLRKRGLGANRGTARAAHAIRGGDAVAQLLIGSDEPGAVIEAAAMTTTGDAAELARALFPNQHPQLSLRDRF